MTVYSFPVLHLFVCCHGEVFLSRETGNQLLLPAGTERPPLPPPARFLQGGQPCTVLMSMQPPSKQCLRDRLPCQFVGCDSLKTVGPRLLELCGQVPGHVERESCTVRAANFVCVERTSSPISREGSYENLFADLSLFPQVAAEKKVSVRGMEGGREERRALEGGREAPEWELGGE